MQGGLLLWTGDTLANNFIGGFKEGVGGALRPCRQCMATREEISDKVGIKICLIIKFDFVS